MRRLLVRDVAIVASVLAAGLVCIYLYLELPVNGFSGARSQRTQLKVLLFVVGLVVAGTLLFRISLRVYTRYFLEIGRAIERLPENTAGEIRLPSELAPLLGGLANARRAFERKTLAALREEQRKDDLVLYLAHDIKTPLTSVIGYLNLLRDRHELTDEQRAKYLALALDKAEQLQHLAAELFDIASFKLQNLALVWTDIDLAVMLGQLVEEFASSAVTPNAGIRLRMDGDLALRGDADKLARVLQNLLHNARVYGEADSAIEIDAARRQDDVVIQVRNRGETIPADALQAIFQQFYRLDRARAKRTGGAGLGLAIARQIVAAHGGTIEARSEENVTTFRVSLPVAQAAAVRKT